MALKPRTVLRIEPMVDEVSTLVVSADFAVAIADTIQKHIIIITRHSVEVPFVTIVKTTTLSHQNLPNILSITQLTGVADTLVHVHTPIPCRCSITLFIRGY